MPLLSPAFRHSHFSRQVPLWNCGRERCPVVILPKFQLPRKFRDLLHAANLRHGTDGFTSPPKEGVLRIFSPASTGFEPANLGTKGQHATPRPLKPLYKLGNKNYTLYHLSSVCQKCTAAVHDSLSSPHCSNSQHDKSCASTVAVPLAYGETMPYLHMTQCTMTVTRFVYLLAYFTSF